MILAAPLSNFKMTWPDGYGCVGTLALLLLRIALLGVSIFHFGHALRLVMWGMPAVQDVGIIIWTLGALAFGWLFCRWV